MKTNKRLIICFLIGILLVSIVSASGKKEPATTTGRVVTLSVRPNYLSEVWLNKMITDFSEETGITVKLESTPGSDEDYDSKVTIDLLGGSTVDVLLSLGDQDIRIYSEAGLLLPLSKRLEEKKIDAHKTWGGYILYDDKGEFYSLPTKQEIMAVFYNRDLFDSMGIAYPSAPWTWDDYLAIAKKISNPAKGVYGSYMYPENPWLIFSAMQKGIPFYKEDGTSNFDDPEFAKAIQWFYDLSKVHKVQMSISEASAEGASWNYFAITDNIAMFPVGSWFTRLLNSPEDYPRDWKYGVVSLPSAGPDGHNALGSMGFSGVNANAANPDDGVELAIWLAKNQWKYESGIPAMVNLTDEELDVIFSGTATDSNGQITDDEMAAVVFNDMGLKPTEILGSACGEYTEIIKEEVERFCIDQQDLDTTIKRIIQRANEALALVGK